MRSRGKYSFKGRRTQPVFEQNRSLARSRDFNNARASNFVLLRDDSQSCCLCYSTSVVHFHFQGGWRISTYFPRRGRAKMTGHASYIPGDDLSFFFFFFQQRFDFFFNIAIVLERLKISSSAILIPPSTPRPSSRVFTILRRTFMLYWFTCRFARNDARCLCPGNFSGGTILR